MRCFQPIDYYNRKVGHSYAVPCGRCLACRKRHQSEWVLRMDLERRYGHWKHVYFVTLTYHDSFCPIAGDKFVLWKDDLKLFFKRFRRYYPEYEFKYFACGEYGDKFDRPHYHLVFYSNENWKTIKDAINHCWSVSVSGDTPVGNGVFSLDRSYSVKRRSIGRITVSSVNMRRIRYCAKYVVKDSNSDPEFPKFARSSKGLGKCCLDDKCFCNACLNSVSYCIYTEDAKPVAIPRYLSHRIFNASQLEQMQLTYIRRLPEISLNLDYETRKRLIRQNWDTEKRKQQSLMLQRSNLFYYGC